MPPPIPVRPDTTPWYRQRRWVILLLAALALSILPAALVGRALYRKFAPLPTRVAVEREAEQAEIFEALTAQKPSDDPALLESVTKSLDGLGAAMLAQDGSSVDTHFDIERMLKEIQRLPNSPAMPREVSRQMQEGLRAGMGKLLSGQSNMAGWQRTDVRSIRDADVPGDVVAYVKVRQHDVVLSMRFWLHRSDRWRVYDYEELDTSLRATTLMGRLMTFAQGPGGLAGLQKVQNIQMGIAQMTDGDPEGAQASVSGITDGDLPPELVALAYLVRAGTSKALGDPEAALKAARRMHELHPDGMIAHLLIADALNLLGRHDEALKAAQTYESQLGPTGVSSYQIAVAQQGLGRTDLALKALQAGLDDEPDSADCLSELGGIDTPEAKALYKQRLAAIDLSPLMFRKLASFLDEVSQGEALVTLVDLHAERQGDTLDARFFRGAAFGYQDKWDEAARCFAADLETTDEWYRGAMYSRYLNAMTNAGKPIEGYQATRPNRREEAFALLTGFTMPPADRTRLIDIHLKQYPRDPVALSARGDDLLGAEKYAEAATWYDRAYEQQMDEAIREDIAASRMYAHYKAGTWPAQFEKRADDAERFAQLARLMRLDDNADALDRLLALHRKAVPGSPQLPLWEGTLAMLRGDYERAVERFAQFRAEEDDHAARWQKSDGLLRAHLHLKQYDKAAGVVTEEDDEQLLLIAAARGNVEQADAHLKQLIEDDWFEHLLDDAQLMTYLQTPAMKPVLARLRQAAAPATQPAT